MDKVPVSELSILAARTFVKLPWTQFIPKSRVASKLATPLVLSEPTSLRVGRVGQTEGEFPLSGYGCWLLIFQGKLEIFILTRNLQF